MTVKLTDHNPFEPPQNDIPLTRDTAFPAMQVWIKMGLTISVGSTVVVLFVFWAATHLWRGSFTMLAVGGFLCIAIPLMLLSVQSGRKHSGFLPLIFAMTQNLVAWTAACVSVELGLPLAYGISVHWNDLLAVGWFAAHATGFLLLSSFAGTYRRRMSTPGRVFASDLL